MPFKSVKQEMDKFEAGQLHSGSSKGPIVKNPKQAIAISLSEKRKAAGNTSGMFAGRRSGDASNPKATGGTAMRNVLKRDRAATLPKKGK